MIRKNSINQCLLINVGVKLIHQIKQSIAKKKQRAVENICFISYRHFISIKNILIVNNIKEKMQIIVMQTLEEFRVEIWSKSNKYQPIRKTETTEYS